jgi:hypothetical protein
LGDLSVFVRGTTGYTNRADDLAVDENGYSAGEHHQAVGVGEAMHQGRIVCLSLGMART